MDFKLLEEELYIYGLASFRKIRATRPDDVYYGFGFYTSGDLAYVATTASSYEGLEQVAQRYKHMERYRHSSIDELRHSLKWSTPDSPLHTECGEILEAIQPLMNQIASELFASFIKGDDLGDLTEYHAYKAEFDSAVENALHRIDAYGVFGTGDARKGGVLNLLMGDQDNQSKIEFAKRVNPPEAVQMFVADLDS